jgi:hypothetical protein
MAGGSYADSWQLSQDVTFQGRVQQSLLVQFANIGTEGWTVPFHRERQRFVVNTLSNSNALTSAVTLFTNSVSANAIVLGDATVNGTVVLTGANRAAQAALVTDLHIDNAIAAQINSYILQPSV